MKLDKRINRPAIFIYHSSNQDPSKFKDVLFGIEEEGVHCQIESQLERGGLALSNEAAENSPLGVGIGIGEDGDIALQFRKLKDHEPLFVATLNEHKLKLRALGANGARLVKGLPFKDIHESFEEPEISNTTESIISSDSTSSEKSREIKTSEDKQMQQSQQTAYSDNNIYGQLTREQITEIVATVVRLLQQNQ